MKRALFCFVLVFQLFALQQAVGDLKKRGPVEPDQMNARAPSGYLGSNQIEAMTTNFWRNVATTNFPIWYFAEKSILGKPWGEEGERYSNNIRKKNALPEILSASEDKKGNWGKPTSVFQLSLRFRKMQYSVGEKVPAVIILRNLSRTNSPSWVRNMMPDMGYVLTLAHGNNTNTWFRPQRQLPRIRPPNDDYRHTDPEVYFMMGHVGELTVIELNDCFDLNGKGEYSLTAQISVPTEDGKAMTNLVSGRAMFKIVKPQQDQSQAGDHEKGTH